MSTYEISKSSLLSLKAEILRKQEELNKAKVLNQNKQHRPPKKLTPLDVKNKGVEQRDYTDGCEKDEDLLKKSRETLELKSRLYEKLSKGCSNFSEEENERNKRFLVRFDKKAANAKNVPPDYSDDDIDKGSSSEEESYLEDYESAKNPDEEWVEYIDCLGRTRECMRKDLQFLKTKDADLKASIKLDENKLEQMCINKNDINEAESVVEEDISKNSFSENDELLSVDMRRELLRQQWEQEQEEMLKKHDVHYQDVLFNEARTHGVGYYGFSKDEDERVRQQEALKKLREETEQQQKKSQELKAMREKQLAARVKLAKNRKRARMGLPPSEDEPENNQPEENTDQVLQEDANKETEQKLNDEKEIARKRHIRPWDIGKEGVKEHYEYSQGEWVDKKRKERLKEFAPPTLYRTNFRSNLLPDDVVESDKQLYFSTKKRDTKSKRHRTVEPDQNKSSRETDTSSKYTKPCSTVKQGHRHPTKTKEFYEYSQSSVPVETTPIVDECDDQDRLLHDYRVTTKEPSNAEENLLEDINQSDSDNSDRGRGVEIAPPPTIDYYGPSITKRQKYNRPREGLQDSIAAGLQFLRQQSEKKNASKKHPSEMFLL